MSLFIPCAVLYCSFSCSVCALETVAGCSRLQQVVAGCSGFTVVDGGCSVFFMVLSDDVVALCSRCSGFCSRLQQVGCYKKNVAISIFLYSCSSVAAFLHKIFLYEKKINKTKFIQEKIIFQVLQCYSATHVFLWVREKFRALFFLSTFFFFFLRGKAPAAPLYHASSKHELNNFIHGLPNSRN